MFSKSVISRNAFSSAALAIVVIMVLALILDGLALAFNARIFMELSLFTLNIVIIALFFIFFKYPRYEKTIQAVIAKERKRRSYLAGIDIENLEERLNHLIRRDDILANENLSLETMALKLNVSKHQLSEFLNQHLGQNFSSFIKKHRIDMAKKLLIQHPDRKILAVAFDVGFKSKSTFNAAFLHFEQITPAEYRKQNQK
jgi:AraC-like DNA-binding protein